MSSQTSKNGGHKKNSKKTPMDSEVTRIVLIFLLFLVIIVLLVAAFMSLGHGAESTNPQQGHVINIEAPADTQQATTAPPPSETADPNHGNTETQPIPAEVLNPELATTETFVYIPNTQPAVETAPPVDGTGEAPVGGTTAPVIAYTTTGTRPENPNPVYVSTTPDPYAGIATLAPPLTTAGDGTGNGTTLTTTIAPGDGSVTDTNYVIALSGSAGIYSSPGGSASGTIGSAGSFTIVQEMTDSSGVKWGKLKSGAGWVKLN